MRRTNRRCSIFYLGKEIPGCDKLEDNIIQLYVSKNSESGGGIKEYVDRDLLETII